MYLVYFICLESWLNNPHKILLLFFNEAFVKLPCRVTHIFAGAQFDEKSIVITFDICPLCVREYFETRLTALAK